VLLQLGIEFMKTMLMSRVTGLVFGLMLSSSQAASPPKLPAELPINRGAGRGGGLIVPVRIEGGEEVPFAVDTGSGFTAVDQSLEPKLGQRRGTLSVWSWGKTNERPLFTAPRLSLAGTLLVTSGRVVSYPCGGMHSDSGQQIMGILGIDCLRNYCLQLDFAAGKMRFLEPEHVNAVQLGKGYPITYDGSRPFVHHEGLVAGIGTNTLIDTGVARDGVIEELGPGSWYFAERVWGGQTYTNLLLGNLGNVLGLRFLARHLVTLDFVNGTMYLRQQCVGPLPGDESWVWKRTRVEVLEPLVWAVARGDAAAADAALVALEHGSAPEWSRKIGRTLVGTLREEPKPVPAKAPPKVSELALGDAQWESATVGWFTPTANRLPSNDTIGPPCLDSGKLYATGLWAHSPSRYVFDVGGKWKRLRGEAGLHTAVQSITSGVVFVIKTDGREVYRSLAIRGPTRPSYDVDLTGVKKLELMVENASEHNYHNWSLWLDPVLSR
jgi:NPCBM/NEW2 domain